MRLCNNDDISRASLGVNGPRRLSASMLVATWDQGAQEMMVGCCVLYRACRDFAPSIHNVAPHKLARRGASVRDDGDLNVIPSQLLLHLRPWIGRTLSKWVQRHIQNQH